MKYFNEVESCVVALLPEKQKQLQFELRTGRHPAQPVDNLDRSSATLFTLRDQGGPAQQHRTL
jgi:hypothetical protein